jgi:hypothetical protein
MTACNVLSSYLTLIIVGVAFAILALVHLLRIVYKAEVIIAGKVAPMWISYVAFVVSLLFALWMFSISIG